MENASSGTNNGKKPSRLPKRIILVRHGESEGNVDKNIYAITPDHKVQLTEKGKEQSKKAGEMIRGLVCDSRNSGKGKVYFYVSPFLRTRETLKEIGAAFSSSEIIGVREESRVREMDYAKFHNTEKMDEYKKERERYGKFFYRFPGGESAADVYDRVSGFIESLWRDIDMDMISYGANDDINLIIISHGLTIRVLLMRLFRWTAEQVDNLTSPKNAEVRIMELGHEGEYSLALHHDDQTLEKWGLSPEMIANQKLRAYPPKVDLDKRVFSTNYFDHLANIFNLDVKKK
ncbi:phosphoglycerate mutase-like protein AT74 [Nicotiana tabacum]|uniref:Phosphoglycerate mutase-like protein AT74 n=1 Tax=Nicotiana tabacum TaxID=4097 RepID=A0A1S4BHF5_TOBAC|nr:PREDICTED: phosphoglycerate mutase-like protein AT74 [Nicotiana tabacum]